MVFFLLMSINEEKKNLGLIVYFFFQSVISLFLFMILLLFIDKIIFLFLVAKLGLFPFFYWIVVVRIKVSYYVNMFVLRFQKISVFWLFWLLADVSLSFIVVFVYIRIFFVIFSLLMVSDLWLLLVYSSISNSAIILCRVVGNYYIFVVFIYILVVYVLILLIKHVVSYLELLFIVFFFIVIPPFVLFFIKFFVIVSLDFVIKVGFFIVFLDVFILLYYFSLIFIKFLLIDLTILIIMINLLLLLLLIILRNCDTLVIFY